MKKLLSTLLCTPLLLTSCDVVEEINEEEQEFNFIEGLKEDTKGNWFEYEEETYWVAFNADPEFAEDEASWWVIKYIFNYDKEMGEGRITNSPGIVKGMTNKDSKMTEIEKSFIDQEEKNFLTGRDICKDTYYDKVATEINESDIPEKDDSWDEIEMLIWALARQAIDIC